MKVLVNSILLVTFILFATMAYAFEISNINYYYPGVATTQLTIDGGVSIGVEDTLVASTIAQDNEDELDFLNAILGTDYTYDKDEAMGWAPGDSNYPTDPNYVYPWVATDNYPDIYAYDFGVLDTYSSYFLLKLGGGSGAVTDTHFIYDNIGSLQYAVIDLTDLGTDIDIYRISHIGYAAPVPEPSTLLLLGAGITGLAFYRRKKH